MKKLLLLLTFICVSFAARADELEVLSSLDENSLPVLNENFRKKDVEIKAIDDRVTTLEGLLAATQAQQETGTSTTTYVSPGRQQYHPSAAKAWCVFDGTATGTNPPTAGYNVTSVIRNSAGNYTVNLTTAFSSANYAVVVSTKYAGISPQATKISATATGTFTVVTYDGAGNETNHDVIYVAAFGDQ